MIKTKIDTYWKSRLLLRRSQIIQKFEIYGQSPDVWKSSSTRKINYSYVTKVFHVYDVTPS